MPGHEDERYQYFEKSITEMNIDVIAAIAASIAQTRYGVPDAIALEVRSRLAPDLLEINNQFCDKYIL